MVLVKNAIRQKWASLAAFAIAFSLASTSLAASRYWQSYNGTVDGDWSDPHHWENSNLPTASDNVYIDCRRGDR